MPVPAKQASSPASSKTSFQHPERFSQDFAHKQAPGPRKRVRAPFMSPSAGKEAAASFTGDLLFGEAARISSSG